MKEQEKTAESRMRAVMEEQTYIKFAEFQSRSWRDSYEQSRQQVEKEEAQVAI